LDDHFLMGIRIMRGISAAVEVTAALLLLTMTDVRAMIRLNSLLGLVGPVIFIGVSALGLAAGYGKIALHKLALIFLGVALVVLGTRA
jgi:hypothetical protein